MFIRYIGADPSRLFALSSQYAAGTLGRQIVWIWFMFLACLTVMTGTCLTRQLTVTSADHNDTLEGDGSERTALLR
jgi:hypothetical protein